MVTVASEHLRDRNEPDKAGYGNYSLSIPSGIDCEQDGGRRQIAG
jgi:hypothetical protein